MGVEHTEPSRFRHGLIHFSEKTDEPVRLIPHVGSELDRHPIRDALKTHYRLTPTEIGLAEALFHGETLRDFAEARGRSFNTVRNQLKSVFAKTGTNRQSDLVALIARLARR